MKNALIEFKKYYFSTCYFYFELNMCLLRTALQIQSKLQMIRLLLKRVLVKLPRLVSLVRINQNGKKVTWSLLRISDSKSFSMLIYLLYYRIISTKVKALNKCLIYFPRFIVN